MSLRAAACVCLAILLFALAIALVIGESSWFANIDHSETTLFAPHTKKMGGRQQHDAIAGELTALRAEIPRLVRAELASLRGDSPPPPTAPSRTPPSDRAAATQAHPHHQPGFGSTCADLKALKTWSDSKAHATFASFATLWLRA